ncbi:MAG: 1-deoxy-D-xylulose-5-phosphate synthase [Lachnospiraceae bacterium]|nr:1-deoxy-D-xylulose-5-phosphate synthase [Lachnospiraceae bacterium]
MSKKKTESEYRPVEEVGTYLLDQIQKPGDIKAFGKADYPEIAEEIRAFLIKHISETGGHLGSNLGCVELTMALHIAFDLPEDKIIWDVGHQSYTHKLLTGRREGFESLRQYKGMSGFPKRRESDCDAFDTGHSSTSISAGLGLVQAREISGSDYKVISVIGDGSLTGGMAYEALNNASKLKSNFIIILNDNNMSISENVGGVSNYLNSIRSAEKYLDLKEGVYNSLMKSGNEGTVRAIKKVKSTVKRLIVPGMIFENMGITYMGPVDGHDVDAMVHVLEYASRVENAVVVHVRTQKGKGYLPAERHPARFHGAEPFEIESGMPKKMREKANYTDVFSTVMCRLGEKDDKVVAITAAMPDGTGLKRFHNLYPDRFFDVGIAEEHAVTFAAGLAAGGLKPVVAIYSSFLQRAYDQILHDVCIQNLPVVMAIDRAGLVGSDGETHQGIFDLSYLATIPSLTVMAPKNKWELADMLRYAVELSAPVAIRYPRGEAYDGLEEHRPAIEYGRCEVIYDESDICLIAVGSMVKTAVEVREALKAKGLSCSLINARFVKPLDETMIEMADRHKLVVTMEENVKNGGFGERFRLAYEESGEHKTRPEFMHIALPDAYVEHGNVALLKKELKIDAQSIEEAILEKHNG